MLNIIKKMLKWAAIAAAVAGLVRWIKGKRSAKEEEEYPGLAEPWPPLDDAPSAESADTSASTEAEQTS